MNRLSPEDEKQLTQKALSSIDHNMYVFDLKKQCLVWIHDQGLQRYGYQASELEAWGSDCLQNILHPEDLERWKTFLERVANLADGQTLRREYRILDKQGTCHWIQDRIMVFKRDDEGRPVQILGVALNANHFKKEEARLKSKMISSAKMAALGEMSGGIAHEINNPLTVIQARSFQLSQMVENNYLDSEKVKQAAESISRAADKITRIIKSLRGLAREDSQEAFDLLSVSHIIQESLDFCRTRFYNHGIQCEVVPPESDIEIECHAIQVEQVLLNLLNNSFDAIQNLPQKWIRIKVQDLGDQIEISVVDSGSGIDSQIAHKIMRPFFTTKEGGRGMGLGLSISNDIIKMHKGTLTIDVKNANTCFVITLPKWQTKPS